MAYELRDFSDIAPQTTVASDITNVSTSITMTSGTGYPSGGASGDFMIQIESELIRCSSRSGNTLTVSGGVSGRGQNGTTAVAHVAGTNINHVHTATNDSKEANRAVAKTIGQVTTSQDLIVADAANSFTRLAVGSNGNILQVLAGSVAWGALGANTVGASQITDGTVGSAELASGAVIAGKIAAGGVSASNQFAAGVVDATALASNAVTTAKILDGNVTQAKLAAGVGGITTGAGTPVSTPSTGAMYYDTTNNLLYAYNSAGAWVCITSQSAVVATLESTTSTSFVDLTTTGPSVTVVTGTKAMVTVGATVAPGNSDTGYMSFAISGATTLASSIARAFYHQCTATQTSHEASRVIYVTGLTAGSNTFKAQYETNSGTSTSWSNRTITVVGIP